MNPNAAQPTRISAMLQNLWRYRQLIALMTKREVAQRYRGSFMGLAWSFVIPIILLGVYTFIFSVVFKARWGVGGEDKTVFAMVLFVGLIVHGFLAEVLNRAPTIILGNVNYVKKVVFPLEILPLVPIGTALFHCAISVFVLLLASLIINGSVHWTALLIPVVFLPFLVLIMGISWIIASVGVFLRDVGQVMGVVTMVMLFLAPVFYPVSALPEAYRPWILANPLSFIIEQARAVLIWGEMPNWLGLGAYSLVAIAVAWAGFAWFQKTRKGFADVL
ncbi:MAG: ABC transporter permease [Proteobacteria bacterium]|nr:ABC transporter permease [Pseudomonadota bacterium]MBU1450608.1 ABC transporter permease [Pseudomonadota bacterium]MBU2469187.1 ABC transporter permease [Pseudomonadota bacterium]MBU2518689.1 ABC transporter permease [Pseudomonadota bacterium]